MNPFRRVRRRWHGRGAYPRGRLHKRIFVWFGISIAITTAVVLRLSGSFGLPGGIERAERFMASQFAGSWDDPARRDSLAAAVARDFGLSVSLTDANGVMLSTFGGECRKGSLPVRIERDGVFVGSAHICDEHSHGHRFLIPFFVGMLMLWGASGAIARKLLNPLYELSRVAQDLGRGQLKSRVQLSPRQGSEFHVLGEVMNEMAARIEQQLDDQRALLATVSHEIRTPLSRMRLLIEFARQKTEAAPPGASSASEFAELEREVTEIDALVGDSWQARGSILPRSPRATSTPSKSPRPPLARASVDVTKLEAPRDPLWFEGDATLVARAVANLLENAKRHAGGVDRLIVQARPGQVAFVVQDSGQGFAPGDETRAFEPFYKGTSSVSKGEQSIGLGLALVKKIAEAHQGHAFAQNRAGGGAEVGASFAR